MRRAKDRRGNPKPLTVNDAFELIKFDTFLTMLSRLRAAGLPEAEARRQAHAAVYPESEPN